MTPLEQFVWEVGVGVGLDLGSVLLAWSVNKPANPNRVDDRIPGNSNQFPGYEVYATITIR